MSSRGLFRYRLSWAGALVFCQLLSQPNPAPAEDRPIVLRVMSYNIHHGEGTDGRIDLERLANIIREARVDLVALQEVDCRAERSSRVDQPAELARLTGLVAIFGKQIPYQGGEYGQAILSRFPLSEPAVHRLPGEPNHEQRIAFSARVEMPGQSIRFVSTHFDHLSPAVRERQAEALNTLFVSTSEAVLVAGDLNALPDSRVLALLREHWKVVGEGEAELNSFPAGQPDRRIDYILYRPATAVSSAVLRVLNEPVASDHCPLVAEIVLTPIRPSRAQ